MPYKDPVKAKNASRVASLAYYYRQREKKAPATCTTCPKPADEEGYKKCSECRRKMRVYKKVYRVGDKPEGVCSVADCSRQARDGFKLCAHCLGLRDKQTKKPNFKGKRKDWRDRVRTEVLEAYGAQCKCCGENDARLLTVDHINGYNGGPRGGLHLCLWLAKNAFPAGFRVLCTKCNFTLGHHGYCPHSDLRQSIKLGRPVLAAAAATPELRASKRAYAQALKMAAFNAYGGPVCVDCGEAHHECLSIDHVANDGAAHRRADKRAKNLYVWLRVQGYPPGFKVLCLNCNYLKAFTGQETAAPTNSGCSRSNLHLENTANA